MGERVHARGRRQARGHAISQGRIVDHRFRPHLLRAAGLFLAVRREAVDRCHLRPGIGSRHRDARQIQFQRDRLGETGRGAAADRHRAVGLEPRRLGARGFSDFNRHMHARLRVQTRRARPEETQRGLARFFLFGRRENEQPLQPEPIRLRGQIGQPAVAKDDPQRGLVMDEGTHRRRLSRSECHRHHRRLALVDQLRNIVRGVFPHQQHRALW